MSLLGGMDFMSLLMEEWTSCLYLDEWTSCLYLEEWTSFHIFTWRNGLHFMSLL